MICVDWAAGAVDPNYVRAAVNTRLVGKQVRSNKTDNYIGGALDIPPETRADFNNFD